jgi:hypothetical protein
MEQAKKPIKKGVGIHRSGLAAFKEKEGLIPSQTNIAMANNDKPMSFIEMPKAFQESTRLPGFPEGYCSTVLGFSDTGKSLIISHLIVSAQKKGYIPVIYDTENNLSWKLLQDLGFKCTPIYGDVEVEDVDTDTGEIYTHTENQIIGYDGDFIYYNSNILAQKYGDWDYSANKSVSKRRKQAVLEDIAKSMNELIDMQDEIGQGYVFIWDSIGSISCYKSYSSKSNNNMWDAGAISQSFSNIWNNLIPSSRKISSKYTNTFIAVNKIWLDSTTSPVGLPTMKLKGGGAMVYAAHGIMCRTGSVLTAGTKKLTAISKGSTYRYGTLSKIAVIKNHLPSPWSVTYEGEIICTPHGLITKDELPEYQKTHISDILKELNKNLKDGAMVQANDVTFIEEDVDGND